ncbi:hypothetical protein VR44_28910 [Streptomyces katrae]|uniref:Uncharacterized protein n=1 Tax=Streptomyces katrae TaxID=68223 RepID=A0A0F4IZ33_9ACTN|nr:hypothetical protein VR44_28910 [Streptomyces katrae]
MTSSLGPPSREDQGTPTTTSSCPLQEVSTAVKAASTTATGVAPVRRATSSRRRASAPPTVESTAPPSKVVTAGRRARKGSPWVRGASPSRSTQ